MVAHHDKVVAWNDGIPGSVADYKAGNQHGWGATTLQLDPKLVGPDTSDFHLAAGSPAVDTGDDSHAASTDLSGAPRPVDGDGDGKPHVDLGAYELGASATDGGPGGFGGGPADASAAGAGGLAGGAGQSAGTGGVPGVQGGSSGAGTGSSGSSGNGASAVPGNDSGCGCAISGAATSNTQLNLGFFWF